MIQNSKWSWKFHSEENHKIYIIIDIVNKWSSFLDFVC